MNTEMKQQILRVQMERLIKLARDWGCLVEINIVSASAVPAMGMTCMEGSVREAPKNFRVVRGSNFDDERVAERWADDGVPMTKLRADEICMALNSSVHVYDRHWHRVVRDDYVLHEWDPNA